MMNAARWISRQEVFLEFVPPWPRYCATDMEKRLPRRFERKRLEQKSWQSATRTTPGGPGPHDWLYHLLPPCYVSECFRKLLRSRPRCRCCFYDFRPLPAAIELARMLARGVPVNRSSGSCKLKTDQAHGIALQVECEFLATPVLS